MKERKSCANCGHTPLTITEEYDPENGKLGHKYCPGCMTGNLTFHIAESPPLCQAQEEDAAR